MYNPHLNGWLYNVNDVVRFFDDEETRGWYLGILFGVMLGGFKNDTLILGGGRDSNGASLLYSLQMLPFSSPININMHLITTIIIFKKLQSNEIDQSKSPLVQIDIKAAGKTTNDDINYNPKKIMP